MPPNIEDIDKEATAAYQPFDVIEAFRIPDGDETVILRPLIMFDDAHSLHPDQLTALREWLVQRELKIARWVLTRLDALSSSDVLVDPVAGRNQSGIKPSREMTVICMQSDEDRANDRRAFRKMAKDMAGRYLRQMDMFNRRGLDRLGTCCQRHRIPFRTGSSANSRKRSITCKAVAASRPFAAKSSSGRRTNT